LEIGTIHCKRHASFRNEALAYSLPELLSLLEQCLMFNSNKRLDFLQIMKSILEVEHTFGVQRKKQWPFGKFLALFCIAFAFILLFHPYNYSLTVAYTSTLSEQTVPGIYLFVFFWLTY
jgi:hypothetical protein